MFKIALSLIISSVTLACLVTPKHTYYSYKNSKFEADFLKCNNKQKEMFYNFVSSSTGYFSVQKFSRYIPNKEIQISSSFSVKNFEGYVIDKLDLPKEVNLKFKTKFLNSSFVSLNKNQKIEVECDSCHQAGLSNIKVTVTSGFKHKVTWVSANTLFLRKVIVARTNIPFSGSLDKSSFEYQNVYVEDPTKLLTDISALKYYKPNRSINKNDIITINDVTRMPLVQLGRPVKVTLKNKNLSISLDANPMEVGYLGNIIKLKNMKTNKIIIGKVIDINKVEVNL